MDTDRLYDRYRELQTYVGWDGDDTRQVVAVATLLEPHLHGLIEDFYAAIERHPEARRVITGGQAQVDRLKGTLARWVRELLAGRYDQDYVVRRWQVGRRHVEIGLDQVYTNVALSRLRTGLVRAVQGSWQGDPDGLRATVRSLDKLLDLDLAIIEDAYQAEHAARLQRSERLATLALAKERGDAAFRQLVEAAECLIVILHPDHSLLYLNPFAERLSGYSTAELRGRDGYALFLPEVDRPGGTGGLRRAPWADTTRGVEHPLLCRDGTRRWSVWNLRRLDDYEGGPALLAVGQDITDLKQAQERALQAERLAAIGQMVAGLAHESRNALQRIQACLEMLALRVRDRPEAIDLIGRIQQAQDHIHLLYEDVRAYSAPIVLDRCACDLAQVWREAWSDLEIPRRGRDAAIREEVDGPGARCVVDPFRMGQVFRNILDNALAACPDPVEVTVRCTACEIEGRPGLRVAVRDNGPGLGPEQRRQVFEPFYTTKTKGTGLGMAIARRVVEAHGGQIAVAEGVSRGAEVVIVLERGEP
jgi:two-component system sensor kinase FixL